MKYKQVASRLLRIMPIFLAATIVFGILVSVIFNEGEPSEAVVNSWFVVGAIYFLIYQWKGYLCGAIYLWSAGTYTREKEPVQFRLWIIVNSSLGALFVIIGLSNILDGL